MGNRLTLAQAMDRLQRKGVKVNKGIFALLASSAYYALEIPAGIRLGLKCWAAVDRIRREASVAYIFRGKP